MSRLSLLLQDYITYMTFLIEKKMNNLHQTLIVESVTMMKPNKALLSIYFVNNFQNRFYVLESTPSFRISQLLQNQS